MGYPRPRVLLVDDDPLVRDSSKVLLNAHGYDVVTASDGYVGIAEIEVASFDLVMADFFMPRMNGLNMIKAIRKLNPRLPIIIMSVMQLPGMSGNSMSLESSSGLSMPATWLQKPFRAADLSRAIAQATGIAA